MPSLGAGALKPRYDSKHLGTEKESLLFAPPEGVNFWADLGTASCLMFYLTLLHSLCVVKRQLTAALGSKCSEMKICVDTLLMTDAHIDLPAQNGLARSTCGQVRILIVELSMSYLVKFALLARFAVLLARSPQGFCAR